MRQHLRFLRPLVAGVPLPFASLPFMTTPSKCDTQSTETSKGDLKRMTKRGVKQIALVQAARNTSGKAQLWYYSHLFGRSEVFRMTLHFSGLDWEFVGFSNSEWREAKPRLMKQGVDVPLGALPLVRMNGKSLAYTRAACRYIAQYSGRLYPNPINAEAVYEVEYILEGAEELFEMLIKYHYEKYNTKGGAKEPSSDEDRKRYGETIANEVCAFFRTLNYHIKDGKAVKYLVGDQLTLADIFVCHYRWLLDTPEFRPLTEKHFASVEMAEFEAYYSRMLKLHFGEYFATRYGSAGHSNVAEQQVLCDQEGVKFPFEW